MNIQFDKAVACVVLSMQFTAILPSFADEVIIKETQINSTKSAALPSVPTSTTVLDKDEISSLSQRLNAMKEQIELGAQKQWLSANDADALRTKANELAMKTDDLRNNYSKGYAEEVEKQANTLNEAISDAMKNAPAPTPATQPGM